MTSRELVTAAFRWWYVMLVGAVLSLLAVFVATHQPPVYWAQVNVLLLGPKSPETPNYLQDSRYTIYPIAGIVVSDVNAGKPSMLTASTSTNMVGQGLKDGIQVRVPNLGSQWRRDTSANFLDLQVAAETQEEVSARVQQALGSIADALAARQDEMGISRELRITSVAATDDPLVYQVGGSKLRAAGASGMSGAAITLVLVCWLDRRRHRVLATRSPEVATSSARQLLDA